MIFLIKDGRYYAIIKVRFPSNAASLLSLSDPLKEFRVILDRPISLLNTYRNTFHFFKSDDVFGFEFWEIRLHPHNLKEVSNIFAIIIFVVVRLAFTAWLKFVFFHFWFDLSFVFLF